MKVNPAVLLVLVALLASAALWLGYLIGRGREFWRQIGRGAHVLDTRMKDGYDPPSASTRGPDEGA